MLFGPENGQQFRNPDMDRSQAMEAGVTGGADRDQEPRLAHARLSVMNVESGIPRPAALALILVANEHQFAVSGEVIARVPAHPIALRAQASNSRNPLTAGAKQWLLPGAGLDPDPQEAFRTAVEG
jgi:hypothetical protein